MNLFWYAILFIYCLRIDLNECICAQAWNGGGTGAWYRLDSTCQRAFVSTDLIYSLPRIILLNESISNNDGFYISLGVFNRFNGVSFDVGLTFDWKTSQWFSYANDRVGWKSGEIDIDSRIFPSIHVSLSLTNDSIHYVIRTENNSILIGEDIYHSSQIDPLLNLTSETFDHSFGFYRFDSIAQINETLKTGSQLLHARTSNWTFISKRGETIEANEFSIASTVRGYPAGSCCTKEEIETIEIHQQSKWDQSDLSIKYL